MPFKIVRNDITKMQVDVIVNTANEAPIYSTGVDCAVYKAAGEEELLAKRREIGYMAEGEVAITPGFALPAKYIIHAVSPAYIAGDSGEEAKLRSCYKKSLHLAYEKGCESIAFPLISTGNFGYPKEEGMRIAVDEINAFLLGHDMLIYLVVFDTKSTQLGMNLYPELEAYIDSNYVCDKREEEYGDRHFESAYNEAESRSAYVEERKELERRLRPQMQSKQMLSAPQPIRENAWFTRTAPKSEKERIDAHEGVEQQEAKAMQVDKTLAPSAPQPIEDDINYCAFLEDHESALSERMRHMSDTFQEYLMYLIENKQLSNAEVYKRAIVTKQLFSKIKLNPYYHPDKATAMRLCVGAKLSLDETKDLLTRAGYALSPCDKRDIIFSFFIEHQVFDMIEIDIALEEHGLPCFIE